MHECTLINIEGKFVSECVSGLSIVLSESVQINFILHSKARCRQNVNLATKLCYKALSLQGRADLIPMHPLR